MILETSLIGKMIFGVEENPEVLFINDVTLLGGDPDPSPPRSSDDVIYEKPLGILIHKVIGSPNPPPPSWLKRGQKTP